MSTGSVDEFLSNPDLCVDVIWAAERARFIDEEKVSGVTLFNAGALCQHASDLYTHVPISVAV